MSDIDHFMPLYVGDYLADTMELSPAQHGCYLLLLMYYWRNGPLPPDDAKLAIIARCERKVWDREIAPSVKPYFRLGEDGRLHQKRADKELAKAKGVSAKRKAAAAARWRGNGKDEPPPTTDASGYANASPDASAKGHANGDAKPHAKPMQKACTHAPASQPQPQPQKKEGSAHALPARAREAPPEIGENLPVLRKTKALRTLLPAEWQPSAASLDHAIRLGFDVGWAENQANRMRNWAEMSNAVVDDWDRRFDRWMEVESYTIRQAKAAAEPKSVHQQIREEFGGGTFLHPTKSYEETVRDHEEHLGIRLTAIAGGKS